MPEIPYKKFQKVKKARALELSMPLRLFLFLVVLVFIMVLGIVIIFAVTGTFGTRLKTYEELVRNELNHAHWSISEKYGRLSVQAVEFSRDLASSIERKLLDEGLKVAELQNNPGILEELLAGEYERALFSLQKANSSGVFVILDVTVNPMLETADKSRAGLFLKNMEPNILSSTSPTITLLRGFPGIGRNFAVPLHAQWKMEFDVSDAPYFWLPKEQAAGKKLPLSRLYYWSLSTILPGTSEESMLCSVPLLDSDGNVFGVCGFEVSSMLFKLTHMPNNDTCSRMFCMLAPFSGNVFDTSGAMFAGGYSARNIFLDKQLFLIEEDDHSLFRYSGASGFPFMGFHLPVRLYPEGSVFSDREWVVALLVPAEDIEYSVTGFHLHLTKMFIFLLVSGVFISFILSRRYIKPISAGLDIIKLDNLAEAPKTNIPEIDDLIEHLTRKNEELKKTNQTGESPALLNEFLNKVRTLSPAERNVFNLYAQQYNAKEIAGILCLSINTIKTHTKRIYAKLMVSSREELLVYIDLLKEAGKKFN